MKGNYNPYKEQAVYCATLNAEIGNRTSTWDYHDSDGQRYEVTARPDGNGGVVTETQRSKD